MIGVAILDPEKVYENGAIDNNGADSDEEGKSGLGEVDVSTSVD